MGSLIDELTTVRDALTNARQPVVDDIRAALGQAGLVGVRGEAGVGKSTLVARALLTHREPLLRVDLDGAASAADVSWQLLRGLALSVIDPVQLSLLEVDEAARPRSADAAFMELARRLGAQDARHAIQPSPTGDEPPPAQVIANITRVVGGAATVWFDHLEVPMDLARQPVPLDEILWALRAEQQRQPLTVVLSCREAAVDAVTGEHDAFYGDGIWVRVVRPTVPQWVTVARAAWGTGGDALLRRCDEMLRLTESDPSVTIAALVQAGERQAESPREIVTRMLALDVGLVAEAVQRARAVHRLGSQLLVRIALGAGPYQDTHGATARDIATAMQKLHRAGLIARVGTRSWAVVNPLVGMGIRNAPTPAVRFDELDAAQWSRFAGGLSE